MISDALEDIIALHGIISVVFGLGVVLFLAVRQKTKHDPQSNLLDFIIIRVFVLTQIIFGAAVTAGLILHRFKDIF